MLKRIVSFMSALVVLASVFSVRSSTSELQTKYRSEVFVQDGEVLGLRSPTTARELMECFDCYTDIYAPDGLDLYGDDLVMTGARVCDYSGNSAVAVIFGDVNGDAKMNVKDVALIVKRIAGWDTDIYESAADLDRDGAVNVTDASLILRAVAGWSVELGVTSPTLGMQTLAFYDESSYGVTWHTRIVLDEPVVKVLAPDGEELFFPAERSTDGPVNMIYKSVLTGLKYDTEYTYRVGDRKTGVWGEWDTFRTRPEDIGEFTFLYFSDTQDHDEEDSDCWTDAFESASRTSPDASFALHGGDLVENAGVIKEWYLMLGNNADYLRSMPLMAVSGNHETTYQRNYKQTYNHFNVKIPEQSSVDLGYFYSFDHGSVHFTFVNTNVLDEKAQLTEEQYSWLEKDLASSDAKWKIVTMHHPLYSVGKYGSDPERNLEALALRSQLLPLLYEKKVDLVLQAHDHCYLRTKPINGDGAVTDCEREMDDFRGVSTEYLLSPRGVVFYETGVTGANLRDPFEAVEEQYYDNYSGGRSGSYSAITVEDDRLTVRAYRESGGKDELIDSFGIIKINEQTLN